ncbi:MAG: GDSL-type esterase/lipase family protein [Nitrospirota bacterium]
MRILFIGHSLVEFFDWQRRFPSHSALNLGVAGETVEGLLSRLENVMNSHPSADLIVLMTGLNNIAMDDFGFFGSYKKIIQRLSNAYPKARIAVNSILPTLIEFIDNSSIIYSNETIKTLAHETGAEFIDAYSLFIDKKGNPVKEYFQSDGVHLSDKGYKIWSGAIEKIISG